MTQSTRELLETRLSLTERVINAKIDSLSGSIEKLGERMSEKQEDTKTQIAVLASSMDKEISKVREELNAYMSKNDQCVAEYDDRLDKIERYIWVIGGVTSILLSIMVPVTTYLIIQMIEKQFGAQVTVPGVAMTIAGPATALLTLCFQAVLANQVSKVRNGNYLVSNSGGNSNDSPELQT